jgi:hypothetical protein
VAVWANNIPEWVVPELAAGLAGVTIVTVSPAFRAGEFVHVLGQSCADGIFLLPEYRGTRVAETLDARGVPEVGRGGDQEVPLDGGRLCVVACSPTLAVVCVVWSFVYLAVGAEMLIHQAATGDPCG